MGLELITFYNGWAMALTGAIIVIFGLATLSLIISQLHKIVALFEMKKPAPEGPDTAASTRQDDLATRDLLADLPAAAQIIKSISVDLGSQFELPALYQRLKEDKIPHPHLTIRSLRESGYLVPVGEGSFTWQSV